MKRIVIDGRIIASSTGRYVERLIHYLEILDKENKYFILVPKKDLNLYPLKNPNFEYVACDIPNFSFKEQLDLIKVINNLNPDLVHFTMPQQPLLYNGKRVTTVHDLTILKTYNSDKNWIVFHIKQLVAKFLFKRIAKLNDFIITPSEFTKKDYIKFSKIDPKKVFVTYESAENLSKKEAVYKPLNNQKFILYVGQQSDYKNIKNLILAFDQYRKDNPKSKVKLVLAGKINKATEKNLNFVNSSNLTFKEDIVFTNFVKDEELVWLYKNAICYAFPSFMEGFGLPGLEAMVYNLPVISSNQTCLPEVYQDAAIYFDPYDIKDIQNKIAEIISKKELRDKLIKNGNKLLKKYSWKKMAKETLEVYKKALDN